MKSLTLDDVDGILQEASEIDESISETSIYFTEDEQYPTFCKVFDAENFSHHDIFTDEWIEVDRVKAIKKALRGANVPELILFVFDYGRLVGRAEHILLTEETS